MNDYRMPEEIKGRFTKEIMTYFLKEFVNIFSITEEVTYFDHVVYREGTNGWYEALKKMCINYELEDVLSYYDNLEWYDSDYFDSDFSDLLIGYGLIKEDVVN